MPHQYEARRGPRRAGPFAWSELRQHAACGRIGPTDLIRTDRSGYWRLAESLPGLFDPTDAPEPADPATSPRPAPVAPPLPKTSAIPRGAAPSPRSKAAADGQPAAGPSVSGDSKSSSSEEGMTRREWWHPWLMGFASFAACARSCQWFRDKDGQRNPARPK
ncbi:MAG TPA: GYF domain-containing protein [Planctomycetaceae bacterium]|nr:GYF domain-containing protein [Planctomycetaceae bacterium]